MRNGFKFFSSKQTQIVTTNQALKKIIETIEFLLEVVLNYM